MKKIPTLFIREFENHHVKKVYNKVTPGLEWVLEGEGIATIKFDGSCCAIINGELYKRYDAKKGKKVPEGAIKCQEEADPITGHLPCWVKCDENNPSDKWFISAFKDYKIKTAKYPQFAANEDYQTFEAVGPHFQGNPYNLEKDTLVIHGKAEVIVERTFEGIKEWLEEHEEEGLVFWKHGEPKCKIKRSDFGLKWK